MTWHVEWLEEYRKLPKGLVTFVIEPVGDVVRLTLIEAHSPALDEKYKQGGKHGWPMILSGLKTLLETGKPLAIPMPPPPAGKS